MHFLQQNCVLCAAGTDFSLVCRACDGALPYHEEAACPRCALPAADGSLCGRCLMRPPAFQRTVAAFAYRYPIAELLHAFKYGSRLAIGRWLGEALWARVQNEARPELILPMPLYRTRLAERGFNQAAEIAKRLALAGGLPLSLKLLTKLRDTAPQASLPWKDRQANVKGAFDCSAELAGKPVAIVDDVMTTGATLNEAAKVLKEHGAGEVAVWVVARTLSLD